MSIRTSAKSIGNNDAKSQDLATAIRKAWLKASDERKAEIRLDFMVGYISGRERISLSDAESIIVAGKGAGKRNAECIDRASSAFRYHIVQGKTKPSAEPSHTRVSKAHRELAMAFLGEFEGETLAARLARVKGPQPINELVTIGIAIARGFDDPVQLAFLENALEAADTTWTIVAMHHPPYSAGYQGSSIDARRAFAPLFEQYGVQLVLSGHDHDYQRSEVINGVTYVVSGAGSGTRRTGSEDFTAVSYAFLHFVDVAAYDDRMVVRA